MKIKFITKERINRFTDNNYANSCAAELLYPHFPISVANTLLGDTVSNWITGVVMREIMPLSYHISVQTAG